MPFVTWRRESLPIPGGCASGITYAQAVGASAFEGHVFDEKTPRPVPGVVVRLTEAYDNGTGMSLATTTDGSGYYSFEMTQALQPPTITAHALFATCVTRRGTTDTGGLTYRNLRPEVYRRDFYIPVPRGQKCDISQQQSHD